jgi:hypothetical protein
MTKPRLDAGVPRLLAGRYQLLEKLADGALAGVWRGHDQILGRDVAVKLLHPQLAADESFANRFRHEAVGAASLNHPGVVGVFDTGQHEGLPYIVMELVQGRTVRQLLETSGPLEPPRAARIAADAAVALDYAHRAGVVHRDVKPANILLTSAGEVKVSDFSIAKVAGIEDVTRTGEMLGTAGYLAPEQVSGNEVDGRADVYSLGVCLYEMLTGRAPFKSGSTLETAMAHLNAEVLPPRAVRAGVSRELDAVVLKAMSKNREDRYQSAQEMASALAGLAEERDHTDPALDRTVVTSRPQAIPGGSGTVVPAGRHDGFLHHEGRWLGSTLLVVILAVAAVAIGLVLVKPEVLPGNNQPRTTRTTVAALQNVQVHAAAVLDPADGQENSDEIGNATDGNEETFWETDRYRRNARFGNLKEGVGLIIDAGDPVRARQLQLDAGLAGGRAEVRAAKDQSGSIDGWEVVGSARTLEQGRTTFELRSGEPYRWYMVWITELPPAGPDAGEPTFQARVDEVRLRS